MIDVAKGSATCEHLFYYLSSVSTRVSEFLLFGSDLFFWKIIFKT